MPRKEYIIHTESEIAGIRAAARATAQVRDNVAAAAHPGMTTKVLDELAGTMIKATGGTSAFLGYRGYPAQICISVNDEVVHGIGSPHKVLNNGDVVSIDVGVKINGYIGDTARTFIIGETTPEVENLLNKTEEALHAGLEASLAGNYIKDISEAIETVARKAKLGVVREYVGHGCGVQLHEPPEIPNFVTRYRGPKLIPGMVLAIEPMFNLGSHKVYTESDNWTVRTLDGKVSAHFEHMVLITETEPEILTWQKK